MAPGLQSVTLDKHSDGHVQCATEEAGGPCRMWFRRASILLVDEWVFSSIESSDWYSNMVCSVNIVAQQSALF